MKRFIAASVSLSLILVSAPLPAWSQVSSAMTGAASGVQGSAAGASAASAMPQLSMPVMSLTAPSLSGALSAPMANSPIPAGLQRAPIAANSPAENRLALAIAVPLAAEMPAPLAAASSEKLRLSVRRAEPGHAEQEPRRGPPRCRRGRRRDLQRLRVQLPFRRRAHDGPSTRYRGIGRTRADRRRPPAGRHPVRWTDAGQRQPLRLPVHGPLAERAREQRPPPLEDRRRDQDALDFRRRRGPDDRPADRGRGPPSRRVRRGARRGRLGRQLGDPSLSARAVRALSPRQARLPAPEQGQDRPRLRPRRLRRRDLHRGAQRRGGADRRGYPDGRPAARRRRRRTLVRQFVARGYRADLGRARRGPVRGRRRLRGRTHRPGAHRRTDGPSRDDDDRLLPRPPDPLRRDRRAVRGARLDAEDPLPFLHG